MGQSCCTEKLNEYEIHMKKQTSDVRGKGGAVETIMPNTSEHITPRHPLGVKGKISFISPQKSRFRKQLTKHERLSDG